MPVELRTLRPEPSSRNLAVHAPRPHNWQSTALVAVQSRIVTGGAGLRSLMSLIGATS